MKTSIMSAYQQIKRMQNWSKEEVNNWQTEKFKLLVNHAYQNTVYYRNLFEDVGLHPKDILSIEDVKIIPVLTKKIIRERKDDLIPKSISSIPHKKAATGGSSGDPLLYYQSHNSWSYVTANLIINWEKAGYRYGMKFMALGSSSLYIDKPKSFKHKIYYGLRNKVSLSGINMSDEVCSQYVDIIEKNKIHFVYGYASSIYLLAKYVLKSGKKLKLTCCFPTSEVLTDVYKEAIIRAFNCTIIDCYGANDGGVSAFSSQPGFFEVGYNCYVTLEKRGGDRSGKVLLTDLFNYAMPFINYQVGDEVYIDDENNNEYPYNGQIINQVAGRTSDIIELENGSVLTGPGFTILFKDLPVDYYCIEKNGVNSIKCYVKKLSSFDKKHEELVVSTINKQIGQDAKLSIIYTDVVKLAKSGKRMYFISKS